ncbi:MAG: hypothetical protein J6T23_02605 [Elusimicrobia bacterium]|nr:hypothetical protein [Elusimicrobiota bacterium]
MDLEYYFIQYLYCMNKELLKYENKEIYKLLFERYKSMEKEIPPMEDRIGYLNRIFLNKLFERI